MTGASAALRRHDRPAGAAPRRDPPGPAARVERGPRPLRLRAGRLGREGDDLVAEGRSEWPLYEVFLRGKRGLNHVHVGSLHASDAEMALRHARDLYTRRNEGVSIWVVKASDITASS